MIFRAQIVLFGLAISTVVATGQTLQLVSETPGCVFAEACQSSTLPNGLTASVQANGTIGAGASSISATFQVTTPGAGDSGLVGSSLTINVAGAAYVTATFTTANSPGLVPVYGVGSGLGPNCSNTQFCQQGGSFPVPVPANGYVYLTVAAEYCTYSSCGPYYTAASSSQVTAIISLGQTMPSPSKIGIISGNNQTGQILQPLASPLAVQVTDGSGNPASGVQVSFQNTQQPSGASGASLTASTVMTGADGRASTGLTLGNLAGQYEVTASCSNCNSGSVTFTETAGCVLTPSSLFHQWDPPIPSPIQFPTVYPRPPQPGNALQYFGYLPQQNSSFVLNPTELFGCALTTTATMLTTFPSLASETPISVNTALVDLGSAGYGSGQLLMGHPNYGVMNWQAIGGLSPEIDYSGQDLTAGGTLTDDGAVMSLNQYLTNHVCNNGDRVILSLNETIAGRAPGKHLVFVTGKVPSSTTGNTDWYVFDPGWNPSNMDSNSAANFQTLSGHETGFTAKGAYRVFSVAGVRTYQDLSSTDQTNADSASLVANSPVALLIVDEQGRMLGNVNGVDVFEIPGGSYFRDFPLADDTDDTGTAPTNGDPTGYKTAHIPNAVDGAYQVTLTGTETGTFTLTEYFVASDRSRTTSSFSGVTNLGATSTYEMRYNATPGTVPQLVLTASSSGTVPPSQVSATASGLAYSRVSQTFIGTVTIKNIASSTINGPIQIVFTSLTTGVTLANASNTFTGIPYLTLPGVTSLLAGQSATVAVQFKNPSNALINFAPVIYSGSF